MLHIMCTCAYVYVYMCCRRFHITVDYVYVKQIETYVLCVSVFVVCLYVCSWGAYLWYASCALMGAWYHFHTHICVQSLRRVYVHYMMHKVSCMYGIVTK